MARTQRMQSGGSGGGGVYGLGLIGAAVYYWRHSDDGAGAKARAMAKALVWPAFVVYDVLEHMSTESGSPTAFRATRRSRGVALLSVAAHSVPTWTRRRWS